MFAAFPTGGFSHSFGFESASKHGFISDYSEYTTETQVTSVNEIATSCRCMMTLPRLQTGFVFSKDSCPVILVKKKNRTVTRQQLEIVEDRQINFKRLKHA